LEAETCRSNLLSTIKTAYNVLEHLLDIFHLIIKMLGATVKMLNFAFLMFKVKCVTDDNLRTNNTSFRCMGSF
jgi:hypothetical protein